MKIRYTDESKHPPGHRHSVFAPTDVQATFRRIRRQLAEESKQRDEIRDEQAAKVRKIGGVK